MPSRTFWRITPTNGPLHFLVVFWHTPWYTLAPGVVSYSFLRPSYIAYHSCFGHTYYVTANVGWALIVLLTNVYVFPTDICRSCRDRPYINYRSRYWGRLKVTIARVVNDIQLNHVSQVPGPYSWSSRTCRLPQRVQLMTILDSLGRGNRHLSTLYSRLLLQYNVCYSYRSIVQHLSTGSSWHRQDWRRIRLTSPQSHSSWFPRLWARRCGEI